MFKLWKKVGAVIIVTYLAFFLLLSPSSTRGAILKSTASPTAPGVSVPPVAAELIRLGFTPRQVGDKITWLQPSELSASSLLLSGAGAQYPHENLNNEWVLALILILAGVGAAVITAAAATK